MISFGWMDFFAKWRGEETIICIAGLKLKSLGPVNWLHPKLLGKRKS